MRVERSASPHRDLALHRGQPGFTLVELLAVMAVLLLLVSLILPGIRAAKDTADRTICGSNLRQLHTAMLLFCGDNQGRPPSAYEFCDNDPASTDYLAWDDQLGSYDGRNLTQAQKCARALRYNDRTGLERMYACPAETQGAKQGDDYFTRSYQLNGFLRESMLVSLMISAIPRPSETLMMTERRHRYQLGYFDYRDTSPATQEQLFAGLGPPNHESKKWNYLFVDGHARPMMWQETVGTGTFTAPKGMWTPVVDD